MTIAATALTVDLADYSDPRDAQAIVDLLDAYARDPMGGGAPLPAEARAGLVAGLAAHEGAFSLIARLDGQAVGLANCIPGYSTFSAAPLINIHDLAVLADHRGHGIGRALMEGVEAQARSRGACKVTLEVLSGNMPAKALYAACGFGDYVLDPEAGHALFWQKRLT